MRSSLERRSSDSGYDFGRGRELAARRRQRPDTPKAHQREDGEGSQPRPWEARADQWRLPYERVCLQIRCNYARRCPAWSTLRCPRPFVGAALLALSGPQEVYGSTCGVECATAAMSRRQVAQLLLPVSANPLPERVWWLGIELHAKFRGREGQSNSSSKNTPA